MDRSSREPVRLPPPGRAPARASARTPAMCSSPFGPAVLRVLRPRRDTRTKPPLPKLEPFARRRNACATWAAGVRGGWQELVHDFYRESRFQSVVHPNGGLKWPPWGKEDFTLCGGLRGAHTHLPVGAVVCLESSMALMCVCAVRHSHSCFSLTRCGEGRRLEIQPPH